MGPNFTGTTFATADYTIGQLKGWFDTVASDFHEKMTGVDLDESSNRITVMVADLVDDQDTVAEHVTALGVPSGAVQFQEFELLLPDPVPLPQTAGSQTANSQSLIGALDPMVGGGGSEVEIPRSPGRLRRPTVRFRCRDCLDQSNWRIRRGYRHGGALQPGAAS